MNRSTLNPEALYFCDNGSLYCGKHCGASAQLTGRDISGQRVERVTDADKAEFQRLAGSPAECEQCELFAGGGVDLTAPVTA